MLGQGLWLDSVRRFVGSVRFEPAESPNWRIESDMVAMQQTGPKRTEPTELDRTGKATEAVARPQRLWQARTGCSGARTPNPGLKNIEFGTNGIGKA